jgi:hypothetical protein
VKGFPDSRPHLLTKGRNGEILSTSPRVAGFADEAGHYSSTAHQLSRIRAEGEKTVQNFVNSVEPTGL